MKMIDIEKWNRKEHFDFFSKMTDPSFGIVTEVACTEAFQKCKDNHLSFFAYYLHKSTAAVNAVDELKYRIIDGNIVKFDTIHAGTTIGREDGTFGFAFIPFSTDFTEFNRHLQMEIENVKSESGLRLNNDNMRKNLIRYSTFPWRSFTALLHPTNHDNTESVPKITFGKAYVKQDEMFLPISIEANHALVDGLHLAQYLEAFEHQLAQ